MESADIKDSVATQNLSTKNISGKAAIFIAKMYEKTNMEVIEIGRITSFILNLLPKIQKMK